MTTQFRNTKQKTIILNLLEAAKRPMSAKEISALIDDGIALSTVYRNLSSLQAAGKIEKFFFDDERIYYQIKCCEKDCCHHHYIICEKCGKLAKIPECNISEMNKSTEAKTGFKVKKHYLQMIGICASCQE